MFCHFYFTCISLQFLRDYLMLWSGLAPFRRRSSMKQIIILRILAMALLSRRMYYGIDRQWRKSCFWWKIDWLCNDQKF
jgi:hypothetical protein